MGLYFSRFCISVCGLWVFNIANDFIKYYKHKKTDDNCICYNCYSFYKNYKILTYAGTLTILPDVIDKTYLRIM